MRGVDKLVLLVAVAVPLVVATIGWPMFVGWIAGPSRSADPTPQVPGAAATSVAVGRGTLPTPRPTVGPPATVNPGTTTAPQPAAPQPTVAPEAAGGTANTPVPIAAATSGDPGQAVQNFYALVANRQFATAAQLWSPRMRSAFPPSQNIDQRFSQTQTINLQRADIVSQNQTQATVAVDLVESSAQAGQQHFVGTWRLVRDANGWMLDQPDLQPAP